MGRQSNFQFQGLFSILNFDWILGAAAEHLRKSFLADLWSKVGALMNPNFGMVLCLCFFIVSKGGTINILRKNDLLVTESKKKPMKEVVFPLVVSVSAQTPNLLVLK
ncbi:hypothetical protein XENOCAPTIV_015625 [Xenoophorus captivus]|uniref:Uncharacterized protein n=1 Tax=Xenoophorus captivus TaxID=1517983 RepID=A0ABV0R599_9TELE